MKFLEAILGIIARLFFLGILVTSVLYANDAFNAHYRQLNNEKIDRTADAIECCEKMNKQLSSLQDHEMIVSSICRKLLTEGTDWRIYKVVYGEDGHPLGVIDFNGSK